MIISDLLLGWLHEDSYSLGESGWINLLTRRCWIQVEAPRTDTDTSYRQQIGTDLDWPLGAGK